MNNNGYSKTDIKHLKDQINTEKDNHYLLNYSSDKAIWLFLHNHIINDLDKNNGDDSYFMSRCLDEVTKHYKKTFNEYPATGKPIKKL